jgi:signal peptidase I
VVSRRDRYGWRCGVSRCDRYGWRCGVSRCDRYVGGVFFRAVLVQGPSMVPTLRHGDAVLVRPGARIRPGDVVIARFHSRPELLVLKRAVRPEADGWWLIGDNPYVTDDSRAYGPAEVVGRVVARYWPRPKLIWPAQGNGKA